MYTLIAPTVILMENLPFVIKLKASFSKKSESDDDTDDTDDSLHQETLMHALKMEEAIVTMLTSFIVIQVFGVAVPLLFFVGPFMIWFGYCAWSQVCLSQAT